MSISIQGTDIGVVHTIAPRSGVAFRLRKGQTLTVIDREGQQVSDMLAYNADDTNEVISSGRSIDYASRLFLTTGDILYSNRSNPMLVIGEDQVGRHDFTLTPCSKDTFRIIYGDRNPWPPMASARTRFPSPSMSSCMWPRMGRQVTSRSCRRSASRATSRGFTPRWISSWR